MNEWEMTLAGTDAGSAAEVMPARLSFDEAFAAHHRLVYRYACALTRDVGLAEDVTQEVFLRLHRHLDAAQQAGMLRAWLLRVAANVARNILRTRRRSAIRDEAFQIEIAQRQGAETLERRAEIAQAHQALEKLQEPYRSCLLLRHEGLSYREIASALGVKETSVGSLIVRGRNEFMKHHKRIGQEK